MADSELEIVEMQLTEIQATDGAGAQIMVLTETIGHRRFPIYIGFYEMDALDRALHGKVTSRPLTHDLVLNTVEGLGGQLERVIVDNLRDDTFFAKLEIRRPDGSTALVDSRPSDAVVLAVRRRVPIFVAEQVLDTIEQHHED